MINLLLECEKLSKYYQVVISLSSPHSEFFMTSDIALNVSVSVC